MTFTISDEDIIGVLSTFLGISIVINLILAYHFGCANGELDKFKADAKKQTKT